MNGTKIETSATVNLVGFYSDLVQKIAFSTSALLSKPQMQHDGGGCISWLALDASFAWSVHLCLGF